MNKMIKLKACLLVVISLVTHQLATAELYRWVDENGVVHFDETRPENVESAVKVEPIPTNKDGDQNIQGPDTAARKSNASSETKPDRNVEPKEKPLPEAELYVTSWCRYCKMAASFLRSKGVPFTLYDIEKDKEAAVRKIQLDPSPGVPFAVINGFRIHGFSVKAYEKALAFNPHS
jgi:glutaredoxin